MAVAHAVEPGLLGISRTMELATNTVVSLARREHYSAEKQELAGELGVSHEELEEILERLALRGIVCRDEPSAGMVRLSEGAAELTLADVAGASGEWLVAPRWQEAHRSPYAGLTEAIGLVRGAVLDGLANMRVLAIAGVNGTA